MEEEQLQRRLKEKREEVLQELMEQYEKELSLLLRSMAGGKLGWEDIHEIVNEAFYQVWIHADNLRTDKGTIKAYLVKTARNLAKNRMRKRKVELLPLREEDFVEMPDFLEEMERDERRRMLGEVLGKLKPEEREILIRHYFLYQTTEAIAGEMNMKRETVKSKLRRGRKKLQVYLLERGITE